MIQAIKVTNKSSTYNGKMIDWQEVTLVSGVKVACVEGILMDSNVAVKLYPMSDSTYSFTVICNRRNETIDMSSVHIPKRRN